MALQFAITASGGMVMQSAVNQFGSLAGGGLYGGRKAGDTGGAGNDRPGPAMASYAGQNFGKGDLDRVKKGVRAA